MQMQSVRTFTHIFKKCKSLRSLNRNRFPQKYGYSTNDRNSDLFTGKKIAEVDKNTLGEIGAKYQVFQDKDADIILDVYEEKLKYQHLLEENEEEEIDPFDGLNLQRGLTGVYDIEDLVEVLKRENAVDVFVARVPDEIKYIDYICAVSGKSQKHMQAIIQFVRRVYKQKRNQNDFIPRIEGGKSKDWIALDLGNIALHVFSKQARALYDLDTLWAVGPQYDDETKKPEPISDMLEKHTIYLEGLEPAS